MKTGFLVNHLMPIKVINDIPQQDVKVISVHASYELAAQGLLDYIIKTNPEEGDFQIRKIDK